MKTRKVLVSILLAFSAGITNAQDKPSGGNDVFARHLFSPELILQYQEEIRLTDRQRESVMRAVEEIRNGSPRTQAEIERHMNKLAELLKKEGVDEDAVLRELEQIQEQQARQAREHIRRMIQIKNELDREQQARLEEFKKKGPPQFPPPSLKEKLETLQSKIQDWVTSGHDPAPVAELMQDFEPLLKKGKLKEAEALLTKALKLVEE